MPFVVQNMVTYRNIGIMRNEMKYAILIYKVLCRRIFKFFRSMMINFFHVVAFEVLPEYVNRTNRVKFPFPLNSLLGSLFASIFFEISSSRFISF